MFTIALEFSSTHLGSRSTNCAIFLAINIKGVAFEVEEEIGESKRMPKKK